MHKNYSEKFKAKVALEAIKGDKTIAEIAGEYEIHANLVSNWKKQLLDNIEIAFKRDSNKRDSKEKKEIDMLYKTIGRLNIENEWLKKKL